MIGYALRRDKASERKREENTVQREIKRGGCADEREKEWPTHGDTKWLNDSVRLPLFVDLNHANPFVIQQTVAAVQEQIRRSSRRLVKSIPQADQPRDSLLSTG